MSKALQKRLDPAAPPDPKVARIDIEDFIPIPHNASYFEGFPDVHEIIDIEDEMAVPPEPEAALPVPVEDVVVAHPAPPPIAQAEINVVEEPMMAVPPEPEPALALPVPVQDVVLAQPAQPPIINLVEEPMVYAPVDVLNQMHTINNINTPLPNTFNNCSVTIQYHFHQNT